jgi:arylsulfatase A-like enzyme
VRLNGSLRTGSEAGVDFRAYILTSRAGELSAAGGVARCLRASCTLAAHLKLLGYRSATGEMRLERQPVDSPAWMDRPTHSAGGTWVTATQLVRGPWPAKGSTGTQKARYQSTPACLPAVAELATAGTPRDA